MSSLVTESSVVSVDNAVKTYEIGEVSVYALRGVSMDLNRGEFIVIMGASGSGKTTLLNLIGALDKPTSGEIFIEGKELTSMGEKELTKFRRHKTGFIFQFYNLIPVLTAVENVELPMLIAGVSKRERESRARELLKLVGLDVRADHRPDELSGGEQQRVAIARSLANKPTIILADEPTGDLDSKTGFEVMTVLKNLSKKEDVTVLIVTHDSTVAKMADRIFLIRDGTIFQEILQSDNEKLEEKIKESEEELISEIDFESSDILEEEDSEIIAPTMEGVPEWLVRMTEKQKNRENS